VLACDSGRSSAPQPIPADLAQLVTGEAAERLQGGRFELAPPAPTGIPQISAAEAEALALGWRKSFGQWLFGELKEDRGGVAVDIDHLTVCRRTIYASSSFQPPPPAAAAAPAAGFIVRRFGPQWLVSLCAPGGELQVLLALPAYARGMWIENGRLITDPIGGEWFDAWGVPPNLTDGILTPEAAAIRAARATGRQVGKVPELVVPPPNEGRVSHARWRIQFAGPGPVRSRRSGELVVTQELYVRDERGRVSAPLAVAASEQPDTVAIEYVSNSRVGRRATEPDQHQTLVLRRRPDVPLRFEPVEPGPSAQTSVGKP
jgi:hypothetical protein